MVLEPLEQAVLWISLVAGSVGAAGFFWQLYLYRRGKKESKTEFLSRTVLYPWSHVDLIWEHTASESPLVKTFKVPSATLPEKLQDLVNFPHPGAVQWLELDRLPGLSRGHAFIRNKEPDVWAHWKEIQTKAEKYRSLRNELEDTARGVAVKGMSALYGDFNLAPDRAWEPSVGEYHLDRISWRVVTDSYYIRIHDDETRRSHISLVPTQSDDELTYHVRDDRGTLLKASTEEEARFGDLRTLFDSWLVEPRIRQLAEDFVRREKGLERDLKDFRSSLQEVTVRIAYDR